MRNAIRRWNMILLGLALVLSAISSVTSSPRVVYSVDGVSLGMSLKQVKTTWGPVRTYYSSDGTLSVAKDTPRAVFGQVAVLDLDNKVVSVSGSRLQKNEITLLNTEVSKKPFNPLNDPELIYQLTLPTGETPGSPQVEFTGYELETDEKPDVESFLKHYKQKDEIKSVRLFSTPDITE